MRLTVVINTCALGPRATETTSATNGAVYAARRYALGNFILPAYLEDDFISEVVVVGEWCEGEGYTYIHSPSRYFSSDDATAQREAAAQAATGDIIVFQHDDHILHPKAAKELVMTEMNGADVLVLPRFVRSRLGDLTKPNGSGATPPYIGGHCAAYTRDAISRVPWRAVPAIREWDQAQTMLMRASGLKISWPTNTPRVYDCEVGAQAL